jgi:RNA polymerase sigma-70 factor (ECF subfamily)
MFERNDDIPLFDALRSGKVEAFSHLYSLYRVRLTVYAISILGNESDAQDLVQDFFVDFYERQLYTTINSSLKHFLYISVKNRCLNKIRDDANRQRILKIIAPPQERSSTESEIDIRRLQAEISSTIGNIAPLSSKVFELAYFKSMNRSEIAEEMGISPNTVKNQLLRALKIVRAHFGRRMWL